MKKQIGSLIGAGIALAILGATVFAAPGDQITPPGPIVPDNGCGAFNGVGVAYDGTNILFTCTNEAKIRKTDTSGADLGFLATADADGDPVALDAIAWDSANSLIWGGNVESPNCNIYSVDPTTGTATFAFSFTDPTGLGRCSVLFFDGITVDPSDNTLWLSPDVHPEIYHYQTDGTQLAGDTIDFEGLTAGECPNAQGFGATGCWNSGLAMGLDGNLFAGTASDGKIYQLDPTTPASLGVFSTVTGRDEDLECGPLVNGFETLLSRDYETGQIDVLEAPEGTCQLPSIELDPPSATNGVGEDHTVTATVASGASPEVGVLVSFEVTSGPNVGEVSDPNTGECTTNDGCTTDLAGEVSWTYNGTGGLRVDVIEACFTDVTGAERCARAKKEWVDKTPPRASCIETVNPHGSTVPPAGKTTLPGPRGGDNEDGFYELLAKDNLPGLVSIFITDSFGSGPFGSFSVGDKVKITEAPGGPASSKPMGSSNGQAGAIVAHITLLGDALMTAVDAAGNVTQVSCLVPPPPK